MKELDCDSFGNILEEKYYDIGGNVTQNNPNLDIPFGFAGGLYDKDTKLIKNRIDNIENVRKIAKDMCPLPLVVSNPLTETIYDLAK
ncbi:MAG: hypothetical protein LBL65_04285 [Campylobacteraceae bacterium]|nr:hypothetical protein [Campylobacteraceae bacterium]